MLLLVSPSRVIDGWIRGRSTEPCNQSGGPEDQSYLVGLRHALSEGEEVGVAVYDLSARVDYSDGEFIVYTEGRGAHCISASVRVRKGSTLQRGGGTRRTLARVLVPGI